MPADLVQMVTPVATLVLARIADERNDGRLAQREREAAERQDERERRAFERATLIDLQDALTALTRASGVIHHRSELEVKRAGTFGREPVGEWSERHGDALANVHRLRARVIDAELREHVQAFTEVCVLMTMGAIGGMNDDDARMRAQHAADEAMSMRPRLDEAIGERLRTLT